uniref:Uncharacterized protein n=1 Tax=Aegilops tauschii subsp. strangulata TaxID=200361 RepID=A0A453BFL9_AEGTS
TRQACWVLYMMEINMKFGRAHVALLGRRPPRRSESSQRKKPAPTRVARRSNKSLHRSRNRERERERESTARLPLSSFAGERPKLRMEILQQGMEQAAEYADPCLCPLLNGRRPIAVSRFQRHPVAVFPISPPLASDFAAARAPTPRSPWPTHSLIQLCPPLTLQEPVFVAAGIWMRWPALALSLLLGFPRHRAPACCVRRRRWHERIDNLAVFL